MNIKIDLELFRFDIDMDYLPYYTKLQINIDDSNTILDLLNKIKVNVKDYGYKEYGFKIGDVVIFDFNLKIKELVSKFGKRWTVNPLHQKLVTKDLIINTNIFFNKISILEKYGLNEDKDFIASFIPYAYATPISMEFDNYLGEAFFAIAYSIYQTNRDNSILELVANMENGIFNAQNIETYIYPQDDKLDRYIYEFQKIILDKYNNKEIQKLKTEISQ